MTKTYCKSNPRTLGQRNVVLIKMLSHLNLSNQAFFPPFLQNPSSTLGCSKNVEIFKQIIIIRKVTFEPSYKKKKTI